MSNRESVNIFFQRSSHAGATFIHPPAAKMRGGAPAAGTAALVRAGAKAPCREAGAPVVVPRRALRFTRSRDARSLEERGNPALSYSKTGRGVWPTNLPNDRTCRRLF